MWRSSGWLLGTAVVSALGCGDGGTGPAGDTEGKRLATQFERLADSVGGSGDSLTAEALRHAAEIVRLTGHATPVAITIDGTNRNFLAVAEQLDFPQLQCSWPSDSGDGQPGDTVVVDPGSGGGGSGNPSDTMLTAMDSVVNPPPPGPPGGCTEVGTFSMRTFIAWEPENMAEVVRLVADVGSNGVEANVPDVMTGLPTDTSAGGPPTLPPAPGDSGVGGGGNGGGGFPGFIGEYLVREVGSWFAAEGSETNSLDGSGGACTSDRTTFDWAQFSCEAARFRFEFRMRVEPLRIVEPPRPMAESSPPQPEGDHVLAMAGTGVDGVRLTAVAWTPPPVPVPGPLPPDSTVAPSASQLLGKPRKAPS